MASDRTTSKPEAGLGDGTGSSDPRARGTARASAAAASEGARSNDVSPAATPAAAAADSGASLLHAAPTVASGADDAAGSEESSQLGLISALREGAAVPPVPSAASSSTPQTAAIAGTVVPQAAAAAAAQPAGILSGLLSVLGLSSSGAGTGSPIAPFAYLTAALELVRREITKLLFNQGPTAAPALISEVAPGVMTGSLNAVDGEGDPLSFTVVQAPAHGTVAVDSEGSFTYTAGEDLAATGGVDDFVVEVRDTGFHLNFWTPVTTQVPVTVVINSAQGASGPLAAAAVAGGRTTAITWSWGAHPVLNFNPATDALDFGWMQADQFGVSDASGSTVISVLGNDHSYTLRDVPLSQLQMGNIVAKDSGTLAKWQGLLDATPPAPTPTVPALSIGGASVAEGNSGTSNLSFTVSLSNAATGPVTVRYATSDGTATAGSDYVGASGTMTFAAGESSKTINVSVIGDTAIEANETLAMTLSNPSGATLATASALGTIVNDDTAGGPGAGPGVVYDVTTSGPDIVGFNPAKDKLNLGDVSVHNFIVVDTAEGVGFRSPWTGETAVIAGVSLGQLTIDSFTPIINDHLRQDLSGAMAWEHGVTPKPNTVYARSHEVGQIDRVAFNPATDVVDFRYYGSREQISMTDSPQGVIISNAGTGQALILEGVTKSQLGVKNFVFHPAQVREDALNTQLGIGAVPDTQVLPQGVLVAGTNNWPTAAGNGTPPSGQSGTTTVIGWHWGSHAVLNFDPEVDKLDFGWFQADNFEISEVTGSTRIAIVNNDQSYTLNGASLAELTPANIVALDDGARQKWFDAINSAAPSVTLPRLSVADASVVEGNSGTSNMVFTVTLSQASDDVVTVGYTTSNGSAYADDYAPAVGLLTFAPGETSKNVTVGVVGDTLVELDEQFAVNLSGAANATIARGVAVGTIVNDDVDQAPATLPTVSIADRSVTEGNGEHAHFMFMVSLSKASEETVTVQYATSNGTALAGSDYGAATGTVTFAPGVMSQMVHVDIAGDTTVEPDETFTVTLSNPSGATIARATATGTIVNDDVATDPGGGTGGPGGGVNSGNTGDALWGEAFFAPYVDMTLYPTPDLIGIARDNGVSLLTLGFLQATEDGRAGWAGLSALATDSEHEQAKAINASIAAFKAAGGDVMISLGGANGVSLAQSYAQRGKSAQELADAYGAVVDTYGLNRIDFDIEGNAVADPASIALNAQALRLFQQQRPDVEIWYTLPVLPSGLTADGLNVVDKALQAGVQLDGVNVMAMDYGEGPAPTSGPNAKTMGEYAIDAAESTHSQLTSLYASHGQTFGWNQLGVTPMIGVNDVRTEIFTVADAQALEDFARAKGLGMLSMWSVGRDNPGPVGEVSPISSGLSEPAGSFSRTWNDYGTINAMNLSAAGGGGGTPVEGGGGAPVEGGATTVVGWHWGSNSVLNFDPAKDKLDFVWMQPANFTVTQTNGSTVIGIVDNNQTYTLSGVALNQLRIGNIVALDSGTTAKWQSLISSALAA